MDNYAAKCDIYIYGEDLDNRVAPDVRLSEFLTSHPENEHVDIIGVATGYTDRVLQSKKKRDIINADVIFPDGFITHRRINPFIKNDYIYKTVNDLNIYCYGMCCFKSINAMEIFDHINDMTEADYCGMLIPETLISVKFYKHNGKTIMIGDMDTESG